MPPRRTVKKETSPSSTADLIPEPSSPLPTPALDSPSLRMSYRIARGEMGVLTFEPYKSLILPYWRFRTPAIASRSSSILWSIFEHYASAGDFVGMDMTRKFIQMGMTRAKRYANHKGGRKYAVGADGEGRGDQLPKSKGHKDQEEKEMASLVFREVWERCKAHDRYAELKKEFLAEQKEWEKMEKKKVKKEEEVS